MRTTHEELQIQTQYRLIEELSESEKRYRSLIDNLKDVVFETDAAGLCTFLNPAWVEITGFGIEESLGKPLFDFIHPDDRQLNAERFRYVIERRDGYSCNHEARFLRKQGGFCWLQVYAHPVLDDSATVTGISGTLKDVTARHQMEEQLRQHQAELAHVSRLSTMGEMAAGLAHELNQPLAAIVNYTQGCVRRLGSRGEMDVRALQMAMEEVSAQAARAGEIIRRLRDFVRKGEIKQSTVDINTLITVALNLVQPEARHQGINVQLELAQQLPPVSVDPIQIEQVIVNLARNAIEAMSGVDWPMRGLSIRSSLTENGMIEVALRDTGEGLAEELLKQLFYPFFTTKAAGLGMGLNISRSIIEAHQGRLWATQNPDCGMTFHFTLPVENPEG